MLPLTKKMIEAARSRTSVACNEYHCHGSGCLWADSAKGGDDRDIAIVDLSSELEFLRAQIAEFAKKHGQ